jgi:hypothetical protein
MVIISSDRDPMVISLKNATQTINNPNLPPQNKQATRQKAKETHSNANPNKHSKSNLTTDSNKTTRPN